MARWRELSRVGVLEGVIFGPAQKNRLFQNLAQKTPQKTLENPPNFRQWIF
jgi:hypothetical protein